MIKIYFLLSGDDGHTSQFDWDWLQQNCRNNLQDNFCRTTEPLLWDSNCQPSENYYSIDFDFYMGQNAGLKEAMIKLIKHGFCTVVNSPKTFQGTQIVSER